MRAGRLRHRLVLQSKTETRNAYGEAVITWATQATVWGSIEPLSGKEYLAQAQVQSEQLVRIIIRYRSGITTAYRVKNNTQTYDIEAVLNDQMHDRMLTLMCREGESEDQAGDVTSFIFMENGVDYLLLETGDQLLLES